MSSGPLPDPRIPTSLFIAGILVYLVEARLALGSLAERVAGSIAISIFVPMLVWVWYRGFTVEHPIILKLFGVMLALTVARMVITPDAPQSRQVLAASLQFAAAWISSRGWPKPPRRRTHRPAWTA